MEHIEYRLEPVLDFIKDGELVVFLSNNKFYDKNRKVCRIGTNLNLDCIVGREVACIFVDTKYSSKYTLELLHYLLTRVRGESSKLFHDKLYFVSENIGENVYSFYGEVKI